ncbi:MAG: hypothetical protein AABX34_01360, partial [Nanoarchaeota archaeon]
LLDAANSRADEVDQEKYYGLHRSAVTILRRGTLRTSTLEKILTLSGERQDAEVFVPHFETLVNERTADYAVGLELPDSMLMSAISNISLVKPKDIGRLIDFVVSHEKTNIEAWQRTGVEFYNNLEIQGPKHAIALGQWYHKLKGYTQNNPELNLDLLRVARRAFEYSTPAIEPVLYTALLELRNKIPEDEQFAFAKRLVDSEKEYEDLSLDALSPRVGAKLTLYSIDKKADILNLEEKTLLLENYLEFLRQQEQFGYKLPTNRILSLGMKILEGQQGEDRRKDEETLLDYLLEFDPSLIPEFIVQSRYAQSRNVREVFERLGDEYELKAQVLTKGLLDHPQIITLGHYLSVGRAATNLFDKVQDRIGLERVVAKAYVSAIEMSNVADSSDVELYKDELRAQSIGFNLETQLSLGRNLMPILPINKVFSFMNNEGKQAMVYELSAQEGDYERDMFLFTS